MDDHPSATTFTTSRTTSGSVGIASDWQVEWLRLTDVTRCFHATRLRSLLDHALANQSDADDRNFAQAHTALTDFFDTATVSVARCRRVNNVEKLVTFADDTGRPLTPDLAIQMLVFIWPDPFEFVGREFTPDRRARCFLSEPIGRLMSRSIRLLNLPIAAPSAIPPIAGDSNGRVAMPSWLPVEPFDTLMQSMHWPEDAVTEAQLSTLSLTRRSKRLPGISAFLQEIEDGDIAHGRRTIHQTDTSPQHDAGALDIDELDLSERVVTADGQYVSRARHIVSASSRFKQYLEKVEYALDRYVARLLRDRFPREPRRVATVRGQFQLNAAQWMVCASTPQACTFRANAMIAERGWLTSAARQTVAGQSLPPWILPVLNVIDIRGPVRRAMGLALAAEMRRISKQSMRSFPMLRPAMMRYLASPDCNTLPVELIPSLLLTLTPHSPALWPKDQSRVRSLAEAAHIRLQWQTALLLHAERWSVTEASLRILRNTLLNTATAETEKQLRGLTALTMDDWVDQFRNPIAHVWQSDSAMVEGSEIPWQALFARWLDTVATLVPKGAVSSASEAQIDALSASSVRALRRALTSLSVHTSLSGLLVADLSNDSMPDETRQLLNVLNRRFRSMDGFDVPEGETGFIFPRFVDPSTFEIAVHGVVYRAEVLTQLNRIREIGDLMENCLRRLHSVAHMLTRGDVLIAWAAASAPDLPIGLVELEPIAAPQGLPLVAPFFLAAQWPPRWSIAEALGPKNSMLNEAQREVAALIANRFQALTKSTVNSKSSSPMQDQVIGQPHRWGVLFAIIVRTVAASDMLNRMLSGSPGQGVLGNFEIDVTGEGLREGVMPTSVIDAELLAALQRFRLRRSFEIATSGL